MTVADRQAGAMRNPETESFLKRVEEYDLQRKSMTRPQTGEKPDHLSLERARRLLQGESPTSLQKGGTADDGNELASPRLAYRSAYNYERSFSPEKSRQQTLESTQRTFVISEEDYKLLQHLKSSSGDLELVTEKPVQKHYPSRGRPRELGHSHEDSSSFKTSKTRTEASNEEKVPSLPTRKARNAAPEEEAPSLPIRNVKKEAFRVKTSPLKNSTKTPEVDGASIEENAPVLPTRRYRDVDMHTERTKMEPSPEKVVQLPSRREQRDAKQNKEDKKAPPPVPRKRNEKLKNQSSEPSTFISSMEKNKLTRFPQVGEVSKPQSTATSHLDFLDSVHLTPKSADQPPARPRKSVSQGTAGESFISSALKTISPSPSQSSLKIEKPALPNKPAKLKNPSSAQTAKVGDNDELGAVKLKVTEKTKPKIPAKKDGLTIPRLRPVASSRGAKTVDSDDPTQKSLLEGLKKVKSDEAKQRKPSPPEAMIRMAQLNKSAPSNGSTKEKPITEAEARLRGLKSPPPVPKRNISMPEALKKAERLKSSKQPIPPPKSDLRSELSAVLKAPSPAVPSKKSTFSSSKPPVTNNSNAKTTTLAHPTKSRARGPRRKLPTQL